MIFDELPFEIKEHIFPYVSPDDWINAAKVSKEWLELTLGSIKAVQSCHVLILDHLAEFINQQKNTSYTWVSLLALMPKLEHLECFENTEAFWNEISPICVQLKVIHYQPINTVQLEWNQLDVSFKNLTELLWRECFQGVAFPFKFFELAPKLEKFTLKSFEVTSEWRKKIPKNVKHILLDMVDFGGEHQFSPTFLCQDPSTVETFRVARCFLSENSSSLQEFDGTPRLKILEFSIYDNPPPRSMILRNAFRKYPHLETVKAYGVTIDDSWRRAIPENVKSIYFRHMQVKEDIRSEFSYDWLFQNYGCLQSLNVEQKSWTQFDAEKFCSSENLKQLALQDIGFYEPLDNNASIDPFSDICFHMIRCSHLVDVTLSHPAVSQAWRHIFPPTVIRLKLEAFALYKSAREVFSPQFICENPSNLEIFSMAYYFGEDDPLFAMDLSAFTGMNKLQELHLIYTSVSSECLESILVNCLVLTDLVVSKFEGGAISNISSNLALPSLRNIHVRETVDQPLKLLQHLPKLRTFNFPIVASEECSLDFLYSLREVERAEIQIMCPPWILLRSLVENIDQAKLKYFCLSHGCDGFSFYLTNSLIDAIRTLYRLTFQWDKVLWIKNYPTSPLLRKNFTESLPSNLDELSQLYKDILNPQVNEFSDHGGRDNCNGVDSDDFEVSVHSNYYYDNDDGDDYEIDDL